MTASTLIQPTVDVSQVQRHLDQLVSKLTECFGSDLHSVTLYGSCVTALTELSAGLSQTHPHNINVLVCVKRYTSDIVEELGHIMQWWQPLANTLPIIITLGEWERSQDVFAIEYADMAQQSQCLHGTPMFTHFKSDRHALRLLCEQELHKKSVTLRQQITLHYTQTEPLAQILSRTISSVLAVSRNVIRLLDPKQPIPSNPVNLIQTLNDAVSPVSVTSFKGIWLLSQGTEKPPSLAELQSLALTYIDDVTFLRDTMDRLMIE